MKKWAYRTTWMAVGIAGLYALSAFAGVVSGGPLDPPGPVGSTMKSLDDIPGTWSGVLSDAGPDSCNSARFICVLASAGVRDNETGLVWEKSPATNTMKWSAAQTACASSIAGGRGGWRLPTDAEMRSLLDPNATNQPLLPDNHPFDIFEPHGYVWTSSPVPIETDLAYAIDTDTLDRSPSQRAATYKKWCVRGVQADAPEDSAVAEQPPAWYRTLDSTGGCLSERFRCVLNGDGVLDRETGLVWRITPEVTDSIWSSAIASCLAAGMNGTGPSSRFGWRLPTVDELATLMTFASPPDLLPADHPFVLVSFGGQEYWTGSDLGSSTTAITLGLKSAGSPFRIQDKATFFADALCVRGPTGSH